MPRPERRLSQQNSSKPSPASNRPGVEHVFPYELGSASPNVHSGRMDLLDVSSEKYVLPAGQDVAACRDLSDADCSKWRIIASARQRQAIQHVKAGRTNQHLLCQILLLRLRHSRAGGNDKQTLFSVLTWLWKPEGKRGDRLSHHLTCLQSVSAILQPPP